MKKSLLYGWLMLLVALVACSDKYQSLVNSAPAPGLRLSKDSVVIREKDYLNVLQTNNGRLSFYCSSPNQQMNIQLSDTSGKVHLMYRGVDLVNTTALPVMDSVQVFCTCDTPGLYAVDCLLTDRLGKVAGKQLIVRCTANQAAKPDFNYLLMDNTVAQSWMYQFDASATVKSDGVITAYHFLINGQPVLSAGPFFYWTFHANGVQDVGLYVTDDLGVNSETVHKQILIQ